MDTKTLKALQEYLGTEDIDFEKKVDKEEIEKALALISKEYKATFPEDLANAVGVIAKRAVDSYEASKDVKKAGAKFSKDVIKKINAIIEALKGLIPDDSQATKKSSDDDKSELAKQIAELSAAVSKLDSDEKKDDEKSDATELTKALKDISERVKAMEESGVTKKSITGDDVDDDDPKGAGEDGKILWKSLQPKK